MSVFEPNSRHLWKVSICCFHLRKTAAEAHRIFSNTYDEAALSERTCREWFQNFNSGHFDVKDRHPRRRKSRGMPGHASTSTGRPNIHGAKVILYFAFGETSSVRCIMSCWNRVNLWQGIGIERNWCVWAEYWRINSHSTKRDTTKLSSSMTMLGHMSQERSRHAWKRWNGRSYPTCRTFQTLFLPTTICFDQWYSACLICISALMKKSKNGLIRGSPQKMHVSEIISGSCQKYKKK